jgi:hypothetical protein
MLWPTAFGKTLERIRFNPQFFFFLVFQFDTDQVACASEAGGHQPIRAGGAGVPACAVHEPLLQISKSKSGTSKTQAQGLKQLSTWDDRLWMNRVREDQSDLTVARSAQDLCLPTVAGWFRLGD